jgi:prephenate dehydrogenase
MTLQITIIGLGQIGASIGLALAQQDRQFLRVGSDIDASIMYQATKIGAVDKTTPNLRQAVASADIVILATPQDQVQDLIEAIGPELKPGTVLVETAPVKAPLVQLAEKSLPEGCSYVGLTPILNPAYLHSERFGIAAAQPDLFQDGLFGVITPINTKSSVLQMVTDLIHQLGAQPFFTDLYEIDGLMASTHFLPQFMSAALLNITVDQPGWSEARKVAGRAFAEVSGPAAHLDEMDALLAAAASNRENIVRKLDDAIRALQTLRDHIQHEDQEGLAQKLKHAKTGVHQWWQERGKGNWLAQEFPQTEKMPTSSEMMGNLLGFGIGRKKKKKR